MALIEEVGCITTRIHVFEGNNRTLPALTTDLTAEDCKIL